MEELQTTASQMLSSIDHHYVHHHVRDEMYEVTECLLLSQHSALQCPGSYTSSLGRFGIDYLGVWVRGDGSLQWSLPESYPQYQHH